MAKKSLQLTTVEKEYLIATLESSLGDTRVEAHRTHTPAYREDVLKQEQMIRDLLQKLRELES